MVAMPVTEISTVTMTLWENDEPVGECTLNSRWQLVVRAMNPDRQRNLQRWVRTKYLNHAKMARDVGQDLGVAQFLEELPRYLHGLLRQATRPSRANDIPFPAYLTEPILDLSKVSLTPRRTLKNHLTA